MTKKFDEESMKKASNRRKQTRAEALKNSETTKQSPVVLEREQNVNPMENAPIGKEISNCLNFLNYNRSSKSEDDILIDEMISDYVDRMHEFPDEMGKNEKGGTDYE